MRDIIERAKQESRTRYGGWTPALEEAIRAGLQDGDRIGLGGDLVAHIHASEPKRQPADEVVMMDDGKERATLALSEMTPEQRERMLILKGIQAGRVKHSTGRM